MSPVVIRSRCTSKLRFSFVPSKQQQQPHSMPALICWYGTLEEHSCESLEPAATHNHTLGCDGPPRSLTLNGSDFDDDLINQSQCRIEDRGASLKRMGSIRHQQNSVILVMFHQVSGLCSRPLYQ